jgi:hypothetical protein
MVANIPRIQSFVNVFAHAILIGCHSQTCKICHSFRGFISRCIVVILSYIMFDVVLLTKHNISHMFTVYNVDCVLCCKRRTF